MGKTYTYNIPGCGLISANFYNYTLSFIEFLNHYGHIDRLKKINQLGRLRLIYPGAHHTRYEYLFLQFSLVSELCNQKNADFGLSTHRNQFGSLADLGKNPSSGELLQLLTMLLNIGYLEGTFSTSKALIHFFKNNNAAKQRFKLGLPTESRMKFEETIKNFDIYSVHIFLSLFFISRYKRTSNGHIELANSILIKYLNKETEEDPEVLKIFGLYSKVRTLAYLTLDSHYAPVPFSLNLASILVNFSSFHEDLFFKNSSYQLALSELEKVLQNTVYMSADAVLCTNVSAQYVCGFLNENGDSFKEISDIKTLLNPKSGLFIKFEEQKDPDWEKKMKLVQRYSSSDAYLPELMKDQLQYEIDMQNHLGSSLTRVGLLSNPSMEETVFSLGLKRSNNTTANSKIAIRSSYKVIELGNHFNSNKPELIHSNSEALFVFLCKATFGWENKYLFKYPKGSVSPFIVGNGSFNTLKSIDDFLKCFKEKLNPSQKFEIEKTKLFIQNKKFSGLTLTYLGATLIYESNKNIPACEFDGLVFFPTKYKENFCSIIEAKDQINGCTEARNQLNGRLKEHQNDVFEFRIENIDGKSVVASLKFKH